SVIITFVRIRHVSSLNRKPSVSYILLLCSSSFILIVLAGVPVFLSVDITWRNVSVICENEEGVVENNRVVVLNDYQILKQTLQLLRIMYFSSGFWFNVLPCSLLVILAAILSFRIQKVRIRLSDKSKQKTLFISAHSTISSWMIAMIVFTTFLTEVPQGLSEFS
ncbi:hypothetical protein PENTCL1PPCAC_14265, partial [Pristionchus entomophagus]